MMHVAYGYGVVIVVAWGVLLARAWVCGGPVDGVAMQHRVSSQALRARSGIRAADLRAI
jgi:hypothetical protein